MKKTQNKMTLIEKLNQFGLDPQDWLIDNNGQGFFNTLLLVNKEDPSFRLLGFKNKKGWKSLQVLSL